MNMRKTLIQNLIAVLIASLSLAAMPGYAAVQELKSKADKPEQQEKTRLVLMPLRVSEDNKNMQSAMENALLQGLQQKYVVFEGEQVAQKAKEIFLKESRDVSKKECNEIRCLQDIAMAFQAELIATSNVTKIDGGYLLSLNIQNIFDNKAVYSNTLPCRNCDGFQIVEKLKILDNESLSSPVPMDNLVTSPVGGKYSSLENELWDETQKGNRIADYQTYLGQYPRGRYAPIAEGRINLLEQQATRDLSLKDQNAWSAATNLATETGYLDYLKQYPHGLYIVQAQARIKKIQEARIQADNKTKPGNEFRDCPDCPVMIVVPAGEFNMGSNNGESDEQPVHRVTIRKNFAIGKTEVTQGQWRVLMSTTSVVLNEGQSGLGELVGKITHILPNHRRRDVTEGHFNQIMETSPEYYKNCGEHCTEEQKRAIRESSEMGNAESTDNRIVVDNNPSYFKSCGDECPVEQVSWADAQKYIQKLNAKTGKLYRLPTEAEWEYACRGGTQNEYCGSDNVDSVAWSTGNSNTQGFGKSTHAVATMSANAFGLYDMSGNVWEWVEDSYHASYNGAPNDGSIWTGDGNRHVLRGGAWGSKPQEVRASHRSMIEPVNRGSVGFRVVRVLP